LAGASPSSAVAALVVFFAAGALAFAGAFAAAALAGAFALLAVAAFAFGLALLFPLFSASSSLGASSAAA
jgi:hypothetical protein